MTRRPRVRGECAQGPRPCPWVGCRHHLWLDVTKGGALAFARGESGAIEDLAAMPETCSLDVADRGRATTDSIRRICGVTAQRVSQIAARGLRRLGRNIHEGFGHDVFADGPVDHPSLPGD